MPSMPGTMRASQRYGPDGSRRWDQAAGSGPSDSTKAAAASEPYRSAARRRPRPGQSAAAAAISVTRPGNSWRSGKSSPCSQVRPQTRRSSGAETYDRRFALNIDQSSYGRTESVLPAHGQIRASATVPTHIRMIAAAPASQPSGAHADRPSTPSARSSSPITTNADGDREIVEKVAVRERLSRERGDEDRKRGKRACGLGRAGRLARNRCRPHSAIGIHPHASTWRCETCSARSGENANIRPGEERRVAPACQLARQEVHARSGDDVGQEKGDVVAEDRIAGQPDDRRDDDRDAQQVLREGDRVAARKQDRRVPEGVEAVTQPVGVPAQQPCREQRIAEIAGQRAAEVKDQRKRRHQRQAGEREHDERGFRGFGLQMSRLSSHGNDSPQIDVSHCRTRDAPRTAGSMAPVGMPEPGLQHRFRRVSLGAGADGGSHRRLRTRIPLAVRPLFRRPELGPRQLHRRHRRVARAPASTHRTSTSSTSATSGSSRASSSSGDGAIARTSRCGPGGSSSRSGSRPSSSWAASSAATNRPRIGSMRGWCTAPARMSTCSSRPRATGSA